MDAKEHAKAALSGRHYLRYLRIQSGQESRSPLADADRGIIETLRPLLAEAIKHERATHVGGDYWIRSFIDHGRLRFEIGSEGLPPALVEVKVTRPAPGTDGPPLLAISFADLNAFYPGTVAAFEDVARSLAWAWLLPG